MSKPVPTKTPPHVAVSRIGREIARYRNEHGCGYKHVASKCNEAMSLLYPNQPFPEFTENRINKLAEAYTKPMARGAAKRIGPAEMAAIGSALGISLDDVLGMKFTPPVYRLNPLMEPDSAERAVKALKKYGDGAKELLSWGEFIPCSMATEEYMRAHHDGLFRQYSGETIIRNWRVLRDHYNQIGNHRREVVLRRPRSWRMILLMKMSDLRRIVDGKDEYSFSPKVRRDQFRYLVKLLGDATLKMSLLVAEDDRIRAITRLMMDYDSQLVIDDRLSWWRTRDGQISISEDHNEIAKRRATLEKFAALARFKKTAEVCDLLSSLVEEIH